MSEAIESNRWTAPENQFAVRFQVNDVPGFFSRKLIVEPGTRALIVDGGQLLGEVPPGTYTLESLTQKLKFWTRKQATVILTRQEDFPLDIACPTVPTLENLLVDVNLRLTVQAADVALFLQNLLGARPGLSRDELCQILGPVMQQSVGEAVGRMSITELTSPEARRYLDAAVEQSLGLAMRRYGLRFGQVQTVSIRHERFDEHRNKLGEAWIFEKEIKHQETLDKLYSDDELRRIKRQERTNELEILSQQVGADRLEGILAARIRRIGIRNRLREAIQSEEFDKIKHEEDFARMLQERDQGQLLRADEMEELKATYRDKGEDRQAARQLLLRKLEIERQGEVEQLRADVDHAMKLKSLDQQIELTRREETEQGRRWREGLERERQDAENRRQEQERHADWEMAQARKAADHGREGDWQNILHKQRLDRIEGEMQLVQAERKNRISTLEAELRWTQKQQELAGEKLQADQIRELAARTFQNQIEKLGALEEINRRSASFQFELYERKKRLDAELERLKQDKTAEFELARLRTLKEMGTEALIAAANGPSAGLIVDLKKHEITAHAQIAVAQSLESQKLAAREAEAAERQAAESDKMRLAERLAEAERGRADAMAQAYREGFTAQQQTVQQAFATMGQMGQSHQGGVQILPVVGPVVGGQSGPTAAQPPASHAESRVLVCSGCRMTIAETDKFCRNCGKTV